ncbi:MAG: hypothetical protein LBB94_02245 [Clostridiales bacterium]|jgi:hypothetical protein|nr:hypothetical protein [Clostridiales bacterium]
MMKVILISGKAQHGKTSTADILEKHMKRAGYRILQINYADYVKFVCAKYYGWDGRKDERGRHILQYVGTDIFRERDKNFWVDTVVRFARAAWPDYDFILIADWRFPNEYTRWAENNINDVCKVRVYRPGFDNGLTSEQKDHPSETALDHFPMDYKLYAVDLTGLERECGKILYGLGIEPGKNI